MKAARSSKKMNSSGTPPRGPQTGVSGRGSKMSKKIVKNEMFVQCNEWEAKWMIWLKYMYERIMKFYSEVVKMSSSGTLSKEAPNRGLWQGVQNEQKL